MHFLRQIAQNVELYPQDFVEMAPTFRCMKQEKYHLKIINKNIAYF